MSGRLGILAFLLMTAGLCRAEVVGSVALTSDYVHRGLSQSSENPALQAGLGVRSRSGYYAHLWATTLDTSKLAPDFGDSSAVEMNLIVGSTRSLSDDLLLDLTVGQYESFNSSQILDYDYTEFGVALSFRDRLRFAYAYSPRATDHTRTNLKLSGPRHVAEVSAQWPLGERWSLSGGIGFSDLSEVSDVRHAFWGLGVGYQVHRYFLTAGVFGTDERARDRFIDGRADTRVVATIIASFGSN